MSIIWSADCFFIHRGTRNRYLQQKPWLLFSWSHILQLFRHNSIFCSHLPISRVNTCSYRAHVRLRFTHYDHAIIRVQDVIWWTLGSDHIPDIFPNQYKRHSEGFFSLSQAEGISSALSFFHLIDPVVAASFLFITSYIAAMNARAKPSSYV